jgi:hypothetical protein
MEKTLASGGTGSLFSCFSVDFDRRGLEFTGMVYYYKHVRAVKTTKMCIKPLISVKKSNTESVVCWKSTPSEIGTFQTSLKLTLEGR